MENRKPHQSASPQRIRVPFLDTLRGFTVISMALFHTCYDLSFLFGVDLPWFTNGVFQGLWRASISWVFLFLAGWMTSFSRSNAKRAALYAASAALVWITTSIASVDTAVTFGILFCMAVSTALFTVIERIETRFGIGTHPFPAALACLVLFALTFHLYGQRFPIEGLAWLGFPSPTFNSGDYYPLIPFAFLYLAGAYTARWHRVATGGAYPDWMMRDWCPPLTWVGTKSLPVYLLHQPVILGVLGLLIQ